MAKASVPKKSKKASELLAPDLELQVLIIQLLFKNVPCDMKEQLDEMKSTLQILIPMSSTLKSTEVGPNKKFTLKEAWKVNLLLPCLWKTAVGC
jgi:hypothetical protein